MRQRNRNLALASGAGAAGLAVAAAFAECRRLKALAANPDYADLTAVKPGRPVKARSVDGTMIHAEVFGSEHGPTFVLVPGWTETVSYWGQVTRQLGRRGFRVVAYDLRGQGHSQPGAGDDYSLSRYGEDLEAVLTATCDGRQDVIVAGHSLGAMSLVSWAERHDVAARVCGAALLNTGVENLVDMHRLYPVRFLPPVLQRPFAVAAFLGNKLRAPRFSTWFSRALIRYVAFCRAADEGIVRFYEQMFMACDPRVRAAAGTAMSEMRLIHALVRIHVPALVIAGAKDRLTPPVHAQRIAAALPQLERLMVLPDTAHMGPLERPQEVADALLALARQALRPRELSVAA